MKGTVVKEYEVELNGTKHRFQLSAEDAKRYPNAKEVKAADEPANKSRTTKNK